MSPLQSSCSGVQLVLEDDRGRFPVYPGAVLVALGGCRWAPGTPALHRPQPLLGDVTREPLVAKTDRKTNDRADRCGPLSRQSGLRAFHPTCVERQADDDFVNRVLAGDARESFSVSCRRPPTPDRRQRAGPAGVVLSDRDPDSPFAEVDPEHAAHGALVGLPDALGDPLPRLWGAPLGATASDDASTLRLTRASIVGTAVTHPGQTEIWTSP